MSSPMRDFATPSLCLSFAAGAVVALVSKALLERRKSAELRTHAGAIIEGNDLSLFYGDVKELTTINERRKFLPKETYGALVQDAVVCCVDILLVRNNATLSRKECLLVERSTEPVKGVWWLPGGRLLKGETFFQAALRKVQQETGLSTDQARPIQVLGVWNTFFPTSAWDTAESKGTQTVNPIVYVELTGMDQNVKLDDTSENYRWISLCPKENAKEDRYVLQALHRLQAWQQGS